MSISNEHKKRSAPERIGLAVLLGWVIFCAAMKPDNMPGFIQDLFFKQPNTPVVLRSNGNPDPTALCELDTGVGNYGVLTNLYAHLHAHFGPNQDPSTWLYLPNAVVQTRVLPYAVREMEWEEPDESFTEVLIFSKGSKGRGVTIVLDTWPEGYPFGTGRFHDVGLTDSGALFFGANKPHLKYEPDMAFPVQAESACIAPLFADFEVIDGISRVLWKLDAKEFTVVCSNLVHTGTGVAVSFACVLERGGGFRFQYVDVPPNVLAQSIGGVQFMQHGIPLFGPGHNPCGVTNGVEVVFKHITEEMATTTTIGGVTLLEVLLYELTEGRSLSGMVPYKWLLENGFCCHADISQELTPGGIPIETAWRHFIDPQSTGPAFGSATYTDLLAAGLDPNGGATPGTDCYDLPVTFHGGADGAEFSFKGVEDDTRKERFYLGPGEEKTEIVKVWWTGVYDFSIISGGFSASYFTFDGSVGLGFHDYSWFSGPYQQPMNGPMFAPMHGPMMATAGSAGECTCTCKKTPGSNTKFSRAKVSPCYQKPDGYHLDYWPEGFHVTYAEHDWYETYPQELPDPATGLGNYVYVKSNETTWVALECQCVLHRHQGPTSYSEYCTDMEGYWSTGCECLKSYKDHYHWHRPKITVSAQKFFTALVSRPDGTFDEADITITIPGWVDDMANKFDVELEGWREGYSPANLKTERQKLVDFGRWPATTDGFVKTWDGTAHFSKNVLWENEAGIKYQNDCAPIHRFLYQTEAGQILPPQYINFTARLLKTGTTNVYAEATCRIEIPQVVKFVIDPQGVEILKNLDRERPNMRKIGLTNMTDTAATQLIRAMCDVSTDYITSAIMPAVGPGRSYKLLLVDDETEVRGPCKYIIFTGEQRKPNQRRGEYLWGFSGGSHPDAMMPFGTNYVNIGVILRDIHKYAYNFTPPLQQTNTGELIMAGGGSGAHEFGHDSGLVWRPFFNGATIPGPPPVPGVNMSLTTTGEGHYNHNALHDTTQRLLMSGNNDLTALKIRLGRHGLRQWTEYDKLHLQHQYVTD